jgi:hypothetical protein
MDNLDREFEDELKFPMITVAVSHDDINEPIHVDLGSIQPFIAVSILEKVIEVLKMVSPGPKITFRGNIIADPNVSSLRTATRVVTPNLRHRVMTTIRNRTHPA